MSEKFSLCMIVRNCAEILDRCLASVQCMDPDEIVIVNTGVTPEEEGFAETNAAAEKYGAKVFHFPWNGDFSAARNYSFDQCSNEVVMWLDSDDEVVNGEILARYIRHFATAPSNCLAVEYLYEFHGQPNKSAISTRLTRERVVKKSQFRWKSPIHEVLCCTYRLWQYQVPPEETYVFQHLSRADTNEAAKQKLLRNIEIFQNSWPGGDCEPRMLFYWGNTLLGLKDFQGALMKYDLYLKHPGVNPFERFVVLCSMAECHRHLGGFQQSLHYAMRAVTQEPSMPSGWMQAAEACMGLRNYTRAMEHAKQVLDNFENYRNELVSNLAALKARPHYIRAVYMIAERQNPNEAMKSVQEGLKVVPGEQSFENLKSKIMNAGAQSELAESFSRVCASVAKESPGLAEKIAESAPEMIRFTPGMQSYWIIPQESTKKRIALMCHDMGISGFDHTSLERGISGSEEALAHVARCFAARGWAVDVYNARDAVVRDGSRIRYVPFSSYKEEYNYHTVVYWRLPYGPMRYKTAGNKILWLHDVMEREHVAHGYWNNFDRVFCLSDFHKRICFSDDEAGNVHLTRNGIVPDLLPAIDDLENDLDRAIWPSDPWRGLINLIDMWDDLKGARPNLTLDIFYGWSDYYKLHMAQEAAAGDNSKAVVKAKVERFSEREDVTFHGMVPQDECHKAMAQAGWWLYPTYFPEISCISAMKIQALGCRGIVTDDFALSETAKFCERVQPASDHAGYMEKYKAVAMDLLANPEKIESRRQEGIKWARTLTWEAVAEDWENLFLSLKPLEAVTSSPA